MRFSKKPFSTKTLYLAFIALAPFVLFWKWIVKGEVLYWGTLLLQFWPWHHLAKTSLLSGQWPLWNPLLGNGTPLLANLQSAVFYPPNLIYLFMAVEQALTFSIVLHLILAGLFMYLYARHLSLSPFAATVSAISYMLSGYIVGRTQFIVMINAAAWIPLLLLFADKLTTERKPLNVVWLGLVLALQLLAGHAQLWFYTLLLVGGYILFRGWQTAPKSSRLAALFRPVWQAAIAVGVSLLVAAAQIIPTAEFLSQSPRDTGAERFFALSYSFWPWRLITLLAPNFFGHPAQDNYWGYANYWEDHAYIGVLPLILAIVAIWHYLKSKKQPPASLSTPSAAHQVTPFFALLIPVSIVLAMGWNTPIYLFLFNYVPGFGFFQAPARLLIWYTVAATVLAGVGIDSFSLTPRNRRGWQRFLAACVAITLAGFAAGLILSGRSLTFFSATQNAGLLLILSIGLLLLYPGKSRHKLLREPRWQWLVIVFITIDLLLAGWPLNPTLPPTVYTQPIATAELIKSQPGEHRYFVDSKFSYAATFDQYFRFKTFGVQQVGYWQPFKESLIANFGMYSNLPSGSNNDPLTVKHWQQYVDILENADTQQQGKLLAMMSSGYTITGSNNQQWPELYQSDIFSIQTVPNVLPHAYFVSQAQFVSTNAQAITRLTAPDFDSRSEIVIIGENGQREWVNTDEVLLKPATITTYANRQVELEIIAPTAGFVVLTDTYYPGWSATVNGNPAPILQANLAFRAVPVDAGQNKISFSYNPRSFTFGLWTSLVACLIIVATIAIYAWQSRRKTLPVST